MKKAKSLLQVEISELKMCNKYLKNILKIESPLREQRIFLELRVLVALREVLNYSLKDIVKYLDWYDYAAADYCPLKDAYGDGNTNLNLRDFTEIDDFVKKVDLYILALNHINNAFFYDDDIKDDFNKIVESALNFWFNQIPDIYSKIKYLQPEHLRHLFKYAAFCSTSLTPKFFDEENNYKAIEPLPEIARKKSTYDFPYISEYEYSPLPILNKYEKDFYFAIYYFLKDLNSYYTENKIDKKFYIYPQITLINALEKSRKSVKVNNKSELYSRIDLGIFDKNFNLKYAVEVNGPRHINDINRIGRDTTVKRIFEQAKIPLFEFGIIEERENIQEIAKQQICKKFRDYDELNVIIN